MKKKKLILAILCFAVLLTAAYLASGFEYIEWIEHDGSTSTTTVIGGTWTYVPPWEPDLFDTDTFTPYSFQTAASKS